jgi:hypothetical protein
VQVRRQPAQEGRNASKRTTGRNDQAAIARLVLLG